MNMECARCILEYGAAANRQELARRGVPLEAHRMTADHQLPAVLHAVTTWQGTALCAPHLIEQEHLTADQFEAKLASEREYMAARAAEQAAELEAAQAGKAAPDGS